MFFYDKVNAVKSNDLNPLPNICNEVMREKMYKKKDSRLDHRSEGLADARLIYSDNQKPELIYD